MSHLDMNVILCHIEHVNKRRKNTMATPRKDAKNKKPTPNPAYRLKELVTAYYGEAKGQRAIEKEVNRWVWDKRNGVWEYR